MLGSRIFFFIVSFSLSPMPGTKNPDLAVAVNKSDGQNLSSHFSNTKVSFFSPVMLVILVDFSSRVLKCPGSCCEIHTVLPEIDEILMSVPNKTAHGLPA